MKKANEGALTFVEYACEIGALELLPDGRKLKSGRISPYFFNSGLFNTGATSVALARAYSAAIRSISEIEYDVLFGPAYKGIPLVAQVATMLYVDHHIDVGYVYNRKVEKDHGEGGLLVGSVEGKRVLILDDVITSGQSKAEAVELILAGGGFPVGCVIAFDREEKGMDTELSASQQFTADHGIPVYSAASLSTLFDFLEHRRHTAKMFGQDTVHLYDHMLQLVQGYKNQYGV